MESPAPAAKPRPFVPLKDILSVFLRVGLASFGGSTAAMMYREVVERRHWLGENGYLTGLTIAQVLPGANPVNLALYVGLRLRGALGAAAAASAMLGPPFVVILIIGGLYSRFGNSDFAHAVLGGLAAVGIGMTISIGYKLAYKVAQKFHSVVIALAIFITIGVLHWPMVPVVIALTPASVFLELYLARGRA